jgi:hypothetical protein
MGFGELLLNKNYCLNNILLTIYLWLVSSLTEAFTQKKDSLTANILLNNDPYSLLQYDELFLRGNLFGRQKWFELLDCS